MMTIAEHGRYERYREHAASASLPARLGFDCALPALLLASTGAITWAIRGTTGWGGIDGTIVPGLTWGLLWYYLCARRGVDARGVVFWLGMGIALGGELGYGQYVSWIQGRFNVGDDVVPISPAVGYLWFVVCGIGWGAPGGIVLGWALGRPAGAFYWACRLILMGVLIVLLFNLGGAIDWIGDWLVRSHPGLLFPNAELGIYAGELDRHLGRTVYTNTQNFVALLWWAAAMGLAAFQRDRTTLVTGAIIGGGFGPGFAIAAAWCHGYSVAPKAVDWWKVWELHAGFNLGLLHALAMFWSLRSLGKAGDKRTLPSGASPGIGETRGIAFQALAGGVLIFLAGYEYFFWTGLALAIFFATAMLWAARTGTPAARYERTRGTLIRFSAFLLLFLLIHGVTSRAVVILGIHTDEAIDQYAWPTGRIFLFVPFAILLVLITVWSLYRLHTAPEEPRPELPQPERMYDLLTFIAFVGAVSIWPAKIGALYALFLCLAIFALSRINRQFAALDRGGARDGGALSS